MKPPLVFVTAFVALSLLAAACSSTPQESSATSQTPSSTTTIASEIPKTSTTVKPKTKTPVAAYFIGNSLTWDTLGGKPNKFVSLNVLARQAKYKFEPMGYHILCGSSLVNIANNPDETCVDPEPDIGPLAQAFPSAEWDVVSAQPYPGEDSTLLSDELMIRDVMDSASPDTAFYILTGWPRISEFEESWLSDIADDDGTPTTHARQYFDLLAQRLSDDRDVTIIPVGEVLYQLGRRIEAGDIPEYSDLSELYRDEAHLTEPGQWAVGVTAASVILGVDPHEFGKPGNPWYGNPSKYSLEFIAVVRDVVAEVLTAG